MWQAWRVALGVALVLVSAGPATVRAHSGPPIPVAQSEAAGPYTLAVWADPDVGLGKIWVTIEAPDVLSLVDAPARAADSPPDEVVSVSVSVAGTAYDAVQEQPLTPRYLAEVRFPDEGTHPIQVTVVGPLGPGTLDLEVEALPDGPQAWEAWVYLAPFVMLAGLFLVGRFVRRRRTPHPR